ncbi:MAG: hypothetical protein ONB30_04820 [candidate division KSB1 bacterium]|nr:hypothetical protein [candidate division KSB1 bacterium]
MSTAAIIMMIIIVGGVWGTFAFLLVRVARQEKQAIDDSQQQVCKQ